MKPTNDRVPSGTPVPRKRFRIEKLEERIAPCFYNKRTKLVGGCKEGVASSG